jgi:DNA anti-recombination protein RmuC
MRLCKRDWENMKDKCLQEAEQKRRQEVESLKQASAEEVDRIKVQWAQEVNELRQIHQQLEENARCLSQENDELKQTIEKSKLSLRGQWEHFEVVDKEAKQARCSASSPCKRRRTRVGRSAHRCSRNWTGALPETKS